MIASRTESMRAGLEALQKCKSAYGLCKGAKVRDMTQVAGGGTGVQVAGWVFLRVP